jgi:hypothetical protein
MPPGVGMIDPMALPVRYTRPIFGLCREFCDVLRIVSFAAEMRRLRLVLAM